MKTSWEDDRAKSDVQEPDRRRRASPCTLYVMAAHVANPTFRTGLVCLHRAQVLSCLTRMHEHRQLPVVMLHVMCHSSNVRILACVHCLTCVWSLNRFRFPDRCLFLTRNAHMAMHRSHARIGCFAFHVWLCFNWICRVATRRANPYQS
jgi:hypothetical protein